MKLYWFALVWAVFCLCACGLHSREWTQLLDVETYIEEQADSALIVLQDMDPKRLTDEEVKAKYALLLSMAMDKNHINKTDFEILAPAIDYYQNHGTPTDKLRTCYYQGCIYTNQGDNTSALACFNRALDEGEASEDILMKARVHFAQADVYHSLYKWDCSIEENQRAASLFKQAGKMNSYGNCLIRVIDGYTILKDSTRAGDYIRRYESMLDSLFPNRKRDLYSNHLKYLTDYGQREQIQSAVQEYRALIPDKDKDWLALANAYVVLGEYDMAQTAIENYTVIPSCTHQNIRYYAILTSIYQNRQMPHKALEAYKRYASLTDSINLVISAQNARFIKERYSLELETLKAHEAKSKARLWLVIVLLALSGFLIWTRSRLVIAHRNKSLLEKENENYRLKFQQLETERDNLTLLLSSQSEGLSAPAKAALMERLAILNRFIISHITKSERVSHKLETEVEALLNNRDAFMTSTRLAFAGSHPKFIHRLEEKGLTEWEINYCCLYALGLNGREVGVYIQLPSHYNQSSLIRQKLGIGEHDTNLGIYIRKLLKGEE